LALAVGSPARAAGSDENESGLQGQKGLRDISRMSSSGSFASLRMTARTCHGKYNRKGKGSYNRKGKGSGKSGQSSSQAKQ
jgi:hypothetical protein